MIEIIRNLVILIVATGGLISLYRVVKWKEEKLQKNKTTLALILLLLVGVVFLFLTEKPGTELTGKEIEAFRHVKTVRLIVDSFPDNDQEVDKLRSNLIEFIRKLFSNAGIEILLNNNQHYDATLKIELWKHVKGKKYKIWDNRISHWRHEFKTFSNNKMNKYVDI